MNTKRLITAIATIAVLVLASGLLSSCTKNNTGDLGSYSLVISSCDAASQAQANSVLSKMQNNINQVTGGEKSVTRRDMAIIGTLNPVYTATRYTGNFIISLYWNGLSTNESVNVRDYTFTKQTN